VIVLVGFMGAGKTTVGNLLAVRLGLPFADSNQVIEDCAGRPIRQDLRQGRRARARRCSLYPQWYSVCATVAATALAAALALAEVVEPP